MSGGGPAAAAAAQAQLSVDNFKITRNDFQTGVTNSSRTGLLVLKYITLGTKISQI
jgi:hypothetical protein